MIIGECPYCGHHMWNRCADQTPVFEKINCEECGDIVWLLHSRIFPEAYTDEDFNNEYDVDEELMVITPKKEFM